LDDRFFPEAKVDTGLIPDDEMKQAYKGDYFPIKIQTADQKHDLLMMASRYGDCASQFHVAEKAEKSRVMNLVEVNIKQDVA
jgi:hypothetical protein